MKYLVYKVSADFVIKTIEFYIKCKEISSNFNKNTVSEAFNTSKVNANNAIRATKQLGLFNISEKIVNASKEEQKVLFRKSLQSYKPFMFFIEFLFKGYEPLNAIKIINTLYNWNRKEEDIQWIFRNWGSFAGIFKEKRGVFEFSDNIQQPTPPKIVELTEILNNELKSKIWIKNVIGDAFKYLSEGEFNTLVKSMLEFEKDSRNSIRNAGEILEDFLRILAKIRNIDMSKRNGIFEIAEELRKNKVIASKHVGILKGLQIFLDRDIFNGLSAFRNMSHHGIDKKEEKKWELSSELALTYIIQVILCIKSLYFYSIKNKLIF